MLLLNVEVFLPKKCLTLVVVYQGVQIGVDICSQLMKTGKKIGFWQLKGKMVNTKAKLGILGNMMLFVKSIFFLQTIKSQLLQVSPK